MRHRRNPFLIFLAAALFLSLIPAASSLAQSGPDRAARVIAENQMRADLGDGRYLNPILPGDHPDPSVVRVGGDYYMTHTSGTASPALTVWHSRDLVNWRPLGCALRRTVGDIWAPDITFLGGRFHIYFPALVTAPDGISRRTNFVITATNPAGPWSDPVDLNVGGIDPGHVVDATGRRFLYLSGGMMARLDADGTKLLGPPVKVYDGWDIPGEWNIECKCLESPKLFFRRPFYYLVSAEGGTAGPSTSHMIVVARAASPEGPWENMPANPLLRTKRRAERWWSQGHGTILEAADGTWWVMYHGYENGFRTMGRATLLLPVEWTPDGWPRIPEGADPGQPLRKPAGENVGHGMPLSDSFAATKMPCRWSYWEGAAGEDTYAPGGGALRMRARGTSVADAALLTVKPANHSYEAQVEVEVPAGAEAGLIIHYDGRRFGGLGVAGDEVFVYSKGERGDTAKRPAGGRLFLKIRNVEHDIELFYGTDGAVWTKFRGGLEMSGFHHDTFGEWSFLKIGLYAFGSGTATFRDFKYQGLKSD